MSIFTPDIEDIYKKPIKNHLEKIGDIFCCKFIDKGILNDYTFIKCDVLKPTDDVLYYQFKLRVVINTELELPDRGIKAYSKEYTSMVMSNLKKTLSRYKYKVGDCMCFNSYNIYTLEIFYVVTSPSMHWKITKFIKKAKRIIKDIRYRLAM